MYPDIIEGGRFQSLIGWLQTGTSARMQSISFSVSIPYRLATNATNQPYTTAPTVCFNPLQVGYKLGLHQQPMNLSIGFNPLQVGYKLKDVVVDIANDVSFNPLQVGYKLSLCKRNNNSHCVFQSLIGWLQTLSASRPNIIYFPVSIPYRLATNLGNSWCNNYSWQVSIPYRLATNSNGGAIKGGQTDQFQSLIGWLQTIPDTNAIIRAYLGFNPLQVGYKRHPVLPAEQLLDCFNPLQVGYKRTNYFYCSV